MNYLIVPSFKTIKKTMPKKNKTEKPFSLKDDEKTVKTWKSLNSTMVNKDVDQNLDNP